MQGLSLSLSRMYALTAFCASRSALGLSLTLNALSFDLTRLISSAFCLASFLALSDSASFMAHSTEHAFASELNGSKGFLQTLHFFIFQPDILIDFYEPNAANHHRLNILQPVSAFPYLFLLAL